MAKARRLFVSLATAAALFAGAPAVASEGEAPAGVAYDAHTEVELVAEQASVQPGESITLGLRMRPEKGWHTYWKNPGGSGERPRLDWDVPPGFEVGDLRFPTPERHEYEVIGTNNYGYSEEFVLPAVARAPDTLSHDPVLVSVTARWLTCDPRQCIPGQATLSLELPVKETEPAPSPEAELFAQARDDFPIPAKGDVALSVDGQRPELYFEAPGAGDVRDAYFFPEARNLIDYGAEQALAPSGAGHALTLELIPSADATEIDRLRGVLAFEQGDDRHSWQIDLEPGQGPATAGSAPADAAGPGSAGGLGGLGLALAFAFVGGMLLNLMPCVFPILSLKVLGLVKGQGASRRHTRLHGLSYGAGVLVSFWTLALVLIAIRGAGEQLSWGFHLQSPAFIAVMAMLVFAIGLSLAGVFEIGGGLVNLAGKAEQRVGGEHSLKGAFGTGVLATALATPCTAPLMGPALGFALSQPPAAILAVLTSLGLGMAIPYVLLYWIPSVGRVLPRPGPWMETLKQALSFPMFAVAVWLIWVFGNQVQHPSATLFLLSALVLVSLGLWIYGRFGGPAQSTTARWIARAAAAGILAVAVAVPLWFTAGARAAEALSWEPYSEQAVDAIREEDGQMVFVNFTADWCVNCQLLEQSVLASGRVTSAFAEHDVALLKADWTNHDPDITEALADFDRRSIPFFVLYPADPEAPPIELGEWITRGEVERALEAAAGT